MATKHKTIPIFVPQWGCPQKCLFCNQKAITGQKEKMTPALAKAIIEAAVNQQNDFSCQTEIGFFGGSFTGIPVDEQNALLEVAAEAVLKGKAGGIRLSTRPDYIDEETLARLKQYGVNTIELGAQSMHDSVLDACCRGHNAQTTMKAANMIREAGFSLGLQMMLGLPGDSFESALQTAEIFISLKPVCVRIYPTLVLKDTALKTLYDSGGYVPLTLQEAVYQCAVLYEMFQNESIDVIRMGLLDMEPECICAGPYHSAFGELVLSRVCYHSLKARLEEHRDMAVTLKVHPRYVSVLVGQKKSNLAAIKKEFSLTNVAIEQDNTLKVGEVVIV